MPFKTQCARCSYRQARASCPTPLSWTCPPTAGDWSLAGQRHLPAAKRSKGSPRAEMFHARRIRKQMWQPGRWLQAVFVLTRLPLKMSQGLVDGFHERTSGLGRQALGRRFEGLGQGPPLILVLMRFSCDAHLFHESSCSCSFAPKVSGKSPRLWPSVQRPALA